MDMIKENIRTVSDVAEELRITTGRVRQICREFDIGVVVGKTRLLSDEDVDKIRQRPDRRKSEESE